MANTIEKCYILADEPSCDDKFVTVAKAANAIGSIRLSFNRRATMKVVCGDALNTCV